MANWGEIVKSAPTDTPTNPVSVPSKWGSIISNKSVSPVVAPTPAVTPVKTTQPFSAVDEKDNSFGFSPTEKDASGKPFFAFRAPGDTSTTTDRTRVATEFDPRIATTTNKDAFYNPRSVAERSSLKEEMGGDYSTQLDHKIALELSGSNDKSNLQIEPLEAGSTHTATDGLENSLAREVTSGKKSLFQAQTELAKAKKFTPPFTGAAPETSVWGSIVKGAKAGYDSFKQANTDLNAYPLTAKEVGKNTVVATEDFIKGALGFTQDLGRLFIKTTHLPEASGIDLRTDAEKQYAEVAQNYARDYTKWGETQQATQTKADSLNKESAVLDTESKSLEDLAKKVDVTDRASVDAYNQRLKEFKTRADTYNAGVKEFGSTLDTSPPPAAPKELGINPANTAGKIVGSAIPFIFGGEAVAPMLATLQESSPLLRIVGTTLINAGLPAIINQVSPLQEVETRGSRFLADLPSNLLFGLTSNIPGIKLQALVTGASQAGLGAFQGHPLADNVLNSAVLTLFGLAGTKTKDMHLEGLRTKAWDVLNTDLGANPHPQDVAIKYMAHEFLNSSEADQKIFATQTKALIQRVVDRYAEAKKNSGLEGGFIKNPLAENNGESTEVDLAKNAQKLNQLYKQLDREEQSLAAYKYNPEAHIKAYGEDRLPKYTAKIEDLKTRIKALEPKQLTQKSAPRDKEISTVENHKDLEKANKEYVRTANKEDVSKEPPSKNVSNLEQLNMRRSDLETVLAEHPAKDLVKYVSPSTGQLPEVAGNKTTFGSTVEKNGVFRKSGDSIVKELNSPFADVSEAQASVDSYRETQQHLEQVKQEVRDARQLVARDNAETKDTKSLDHFLNRKMTPAEEATAKRDNEASLKKAESAKQEQLKNDLQVRTSLRDKIRKIREEDSSKSKGLWRKVYHALKPIKAVDAKTKEIIINWVEAQSIAKEDAEKLFLEAKNQGPQNMKEIAAYENGKETPYIKRALDAMGTEAKHAGLDFGFRENYLPHVYAEDRAKVLSAITKYLERQGLSAEEVKSYMSGNELPKDKSLRLKLRPNFVKERIFPDYKSAMIYGLTPKYKGPAQLLAHYRESLDVAIANRKLVEDLKREAKLLTSDDAPDSWLPVNRNFSRNVNGEALYARPELAKLINGKFRDEENLTIPEHILKGVARVNSFVMTLKLSAGIPFTNVNYFSTGQAIKLLTTSIGEAAKLDLSQAKTSLKSSFAYIRANSNEASAKWFYDKRGYIAKMAEHGIDLSSRIGNYRRFISPEEKVGMLEGIKGGISEAFPDTSKESTVGKVKGVLKGSVVMTENAINKAFNEKTFQNMMPQVAVQTFADTYDTMIQKGLSDKEAGDFAADTTRNITGIDFETGRGKSATEALNALVFAPRFREGLVNIFLNTAESIGASTNGWKGVKDPTLAKNRGFLLGMVITYIAYNLLNKKLNGGWLWENPPGRESALRIPLPNKKDVAYIEFMPSVLAFPRNMLSGAIATGRTDFKTATQKFGAGFSMPIQLATQLLGNKDYFGRAIYKDTDSAHVKTAKIAEYTGLAINHPYVSELFNYFTGKTPLFETVSNMSEFPFKFSSITSEQKNEYYNMLNAKAQATADAKAKVRPIYDKNQELLASGETDAAQTSYDNLSPADKKIYDSIKRGEQIKATTARKPAMQALYQSNQKLIQDGNFNEALSIYNSLSEPDQKVYDSIKKAAQKTQAPSTSSNFSAPSGSQLQEAGRVFDQSIIRPKQDLNQFGVPKSEIGPVPKKGLLQSVRATVDSILQKASITESPEGKALKTEALNAYQFKPEMKAALEAHTTIRSSAPEDVIPGVVSENGGLRSGTVGDVVFGGEHHEKRLYDLIPGLADWAVNQDATGHGDEVPNALLTQVPGRMQIQIKQWGTDVAAHELLHSAFAITKPNPDLFNYNWDKAKQEVPAGQKQAMNAIDTILAGSGLYAGASDDDLANERFAYFGQMVGVSGMESVPQSLKRFYSDVFN